MTRIVVKNLPQSGVSEEEIKRHFSDVGQVTDVKLKYNDFGAFRRFAFVGFKSEEAAKDAIDKLNSSYIKTSRISLELCKSIKEFKPNRLNGAKHESVSEFKEEHENIDLKNHDRSNKKLKGKSSKSSEIFDGLENDPEFKEFLNLQRNIGNSSKAKQIWADDADMNSGVVEGGLEESKEADSQKIDEETAAKIEKPYKKHKRSRGKKNKVGKSKPKEIFVNTLKVQGFPETVRRKDVKDFFKPTDLLSIRLNKRDKVVYVSFKDESDMKFTLKKKNLQFYNQINQIKLWRHDIKKSRIFKENVQAKLKQKQEMLTKYDMVAKDTEPIEESGRLFIRNLNYTCTQEDLEDVFAKYGELTEVHFPIDKQTSLPKGYAYVEFMFPQNAAQAYQELNGTIFQGRNFHLIPSKPKPERTVRNPFLTGANRSELVEGETPNGIPKNEIKEEDKKPVVESMLNPGTKMSLEPLEQVSTASTTMTADQSTRQSSYKREKMDKQKKEAPLARPMVKNWNTLFLGQNALADVVSERRGMDKSQLLTQQTHKEPIAVRMALGDAMMVEETRKFLVSNGVELDSFDNPQAARSRTVIIVKNLPAVIDKSELTHLFESACGGGRVSSVILPPNGLTALVEMEEAVQAKLAFKRLAYSKFKDSVLYLEWAPMNVFRERSLDEQDQSDTKQMKELQTGRTKILVKNVPFEATVPELRKVFGAFGELNSVRMPKKVDGQFRGFCFVDYLTQEDALRAFKSLCHSTHLYGRKLVLEWAKVDQ